MHQHRCLVPPAPEVMNQLYLDYRHDGEPLGLTFQQYLEVIGYGNPAKDVAGMDDAVAAVSDGAEGIDLIRIPQIEVRGDLEIIVLLIDFPDQPAFRPKRNYEDLLFSEGLHPTGSLCDYYTEVTGGKVTVKGSVHGWFRMPQPYRVYTNNESGMKPRSYPRNAQRMAEDAVQSAVAAGLKFPPELDKLRDGTITALFIVHSGPGAERLHPTVRGGHIWSHKWNMVRPVKVSNRLMAVRYLTVPEDCDLGVCAHELGHLAFQWQDFYDANYDEDGAYWDGTGHWDLMAAGSYNGGGATPAHPAGLHKAQHGWVEIETITDADAETSIALPPRTDAGGKVVRIESPAFAPGQYILLENRVRKGFDAPLPGSGLLVWRVDERAEQEAPDAPGLSLIQADGKHDLNQPGGNQGDAGDPFPGTRKVKRLGDVGPVSTSFPGGPRSGIELADISIDADDIAHLVIRFTAPG